MSDDPRRSSEERTNIINLSDQDSDQIRRLLQLLLRADSIPPPTDNFPNDQSERDLSALARRIFSIRHKRLEHFPAGMFDELGWDILLLLYITQSQQRLTGGVVAQLLRASSSTTSRWIDYLEDKDLVARSRHPTDQRVMFLALTQNGIRSLEGFLSEIQTIGG